MSGAQQQAAVARHLPLAGIYAQAGFAVFPCRENKAPAVAGGFKSASSDPVEIANMWGGQNHAVGLPCGEANDLTVIDLDVDKTTGEHTGVASLKAVMPELFDSNGIPTGPAVATPSGDRHLFFRFTPELKNRTNYLPCVDIRTQGGYVIGPHSQMAAGVYKPNIALHQYIDARSKGEKATLPEMPQELLEALVGPKATTQPALTLPAAAAHERSDDDLPSEAEIEEVLSYIPPDGRDEWFKVISALKEYPNGYSIAQRWARPSNKYCDYSFDKKWNEKSLKHIPVRTIFDMAKDNGADLSQIARDHMPKDDEAEIARKCAVVAAQFDAMNVVQLRPDTGPAAEPITKLPFKPWATIDAAAIPRVQFVYGAFYAKNYTSVTAAAPKVGKSLLAAAEAVDMASGRGFLTGQKREPQNVLYYCAEDDQDTINGRICAICQLWSIEQSEIEGRLVAVSGVDVTGFALVVGQEGVINETLFKMLEAFVVENRIACAIFDPLQDLSHSPETNEVFRTLGARLRKFATDCDVAVGLIHHTRKGTAGVKASIDDMRGGSALRGTARFNRLLVSMTEDEAAQAGLDNHRPYMRIAETESNLAPPSSEHVQWYEKTSIPLANGASIGAVKPWRWPDAFSGVTPHDAAKVRSAVVGRDIPPRLHSASSDYVGNVIAEVLEIDAETKGGKFGFKLDQQSSRADACITGTFANSVSKVLGFQPSSNANILLKSLSKPRMPLASSSLAIGSIATFQRNVAASMVWGSVGIAFSGDSARGRSATSEPSSSSRAGEIVRLSQPDRALI